jgi:RNA polymerase sigma factor (sigma-70 family)
MCHECPLRRTCAHVCVHVEGQLPSLEAGRVDHVDLERFHQGRIMTHAILDNMEILTARQQEVVQLYYRENRQQAEIARILGITQQAVGDTLVRAKTAVGRRLKGFYTFFSA